MPSLTNVQGDILFDGFPKRNESFFFFTIKEGQVKAFCQSLPSLAEKISDSQHTKEIRAEIKKFKDGNPGKDADTINTVGASIAFSKTGLDKMDTVLKSLKVSSMGDEPFNQGMKAVAEKILQDPSANGQPKYEAAFMAPDKLHGVILVAGNSPEIVKNKLTGLKDTLGATVEQVTTIEGKVRPGKFKGHEHFGYEDGISQPAVKGMETAIPQAGEIREGIALCGRDGDEVTGRPAWTKDGSFMCFRKLKQNVEVWDDVLGKISRDMGIQNPDQLGARLIGRWKSGCPVALSLHKDDEKIAGDRQKVNNFTYQRGKFLSSPAGAHIRKVFPRGDLSDSTLERHRILRRGIPYGDEVGQGDPKGERGLLFVCYQSNLSDGYQFIQQAWANSSSFFDPGAGLDQTMGQSTAAPDFEMKGLVTDEAKLTQVAKFKGVNQFVVAKGGEYFFMPSMMALKTTLAGVKPKAEL